MSDAPGAAIPLPLWRVERILWDGTGMSPEDAQAAGGDAGVLVVDKPAGMPVHGGDESLTHSVVDRLSQVRRAEGKDDYLAVHQRLDQDTSGVLFFVTDRERNAVFATAMEEHRIERTYVAVVAAARPIPSSTNQRSDRKGVERGGLERLSDSGRIEVFLSHVRGVTRASFSKSPSAKRAVTHYRVLKRAGERALLQFKLETGRTHQIRATMAALGTPIVGDSLYGGRPAGRLMLHAVRLSGGPLRRVYQSPIPPALHEAMNSFKSEFPADLRSALLDAACLRAPLIQEKGSGGVPDNGSQTSAFRLVNGEGDGLPGMTVDAYGRYATLNLYEPELLPRKQEIAGELVRLGFLGVYEKQRVRADLRGQDSSPLSPTGPLSGQAAPEEYVVSENGMHVRVRLADGLSTGLFVDMRDNRARIRMAPGARMLNLFSYTCSFSVAAALGGATTTSVDLSGKALERGRENFRENGLDDAAHRFFKEDAMKFLAKAARRGDEYDLIVLDPPSFSTVGKETFSVKSRYAQAATDCLSLLARGGRLLSVTNHTKTSARGLEEVVKEAADAAGKRLTLVRQLNQRLDCPDSAEGPFPSKCVLVEVG